MRPARQNRHATQAKTHTLLSLRSWRFSRECCSFLAAKPRDDWEQVKEGFSPFTRFEWQVRCQESTAGTIIPPDTQATLSFTPLHDFETSWTASELMRCNCEHHRTLGRSSVTHFHQRPQLGIKQSRTPYTHGRNRALLCFWVKSERKKNAGTRH